jgi:DNA-binding PadR family transcriptional regulator
MIVPDVGTLYRALRRMQDQGLIDASVRRHAPDAGDERRNYYRITPLGMRVARAEARRMAALTRAARLSGLLAGGAA